MYFSRMVVGRGASGELRGAGHMLSLRLLADSDRVCYRNCCALSNIHLFAPMQTYVKDMSISPLFVCVADAIASSAPFVPVY